MAHSVDLAERALLLVVALSLPVVGAAALVGLIVAVFQSMTQLSDFTLSYLPRLVAVAIVLALTAPWMGSELAQFATTVFSAER